jgi:hypothetical protein
MLLKLTMEQFTMTKIEKSKCFWLKHISSFSASGLSCAEYCRQNNLVYSQFLYWRSKYAKDISATKSLNSAQAFIPVSIEPTEKPRSNCSADSIGSVLCSVEFVQGHCLVIRNMECLKILPKILGMTSSRKSAVTPIPTPAQQLIR